MVVLRCLLSSQVDLNPNRQYPCVPPLGKPRRPLEVKEGCAARRIPRGPDRGGRHEIDICVGGRGHIAGAPTPNPPQIRCPPRGALGSVGARAPCWGAAGLSLAAALRRPHLLLSNPNRQYPCVPHSSCLRMRNARATHHSTPDSLPGEYRAGGRFPRPPTPGGREPAPLYLSTRQAHAGAAPVACCGV